jgi:hypothetical protein
MPRSFFYPVGMKKYATNLVWVGVTLVSFTSCEGMMDKKPAGPVSQTSKIPWNTPVAGQGQGQFGMMPQNQYRR